MRYRSMAQIGKDDSVPFDELRNLINQIFISAKVLARLWARDHFRTEDAQEKHWNDIEKYEAIFWDGMSEENPINGKLYDTIKKIESTCNNVISGAGTLHGFLNLPLRKKANKAS